MFESLLETQWNYLLYERWIRQLVQTVHLNFPQLFNACVTSRPVQRSILFTPASCSTRDYHDQGKRTRLLKKLNRISELDAYL